MVHCSLHVLSDLRAPQSQQVTEVSLQAPENSPRITLARKKFLKFKEREKNKKEKKEKKKKERKKKKLADFLQRFSAGAGRGRLRPTAPLQEPPPGSPVEINQGLKMPVPQGT